MPRGDVGQSHAPSRGIVVRCSNGTMDDAPSWCAMDWGAEICNKL